ncbi:Bug family tripartite tricarboxylate transporter substrate binding protein [Salinicola peritrichatus]|uniref:Bug family tripartite tricarboxylate transporter substrate binding protein n=1 Tax=Salinicola peritrichatus TaxID=1267424 RepID=UPI000DA1D7B0|nr:tripartite tricarboxylate transporter substrate binding protein [Salinicola peritrichatus]
MPSTKRTLLSCAALIAAIGVIGTPALAQDDFPSGPLEIVTHASAGGGTDTTVRTLIPDLEKDLGVPVSVNMKLGGSGRVAMNYLRSRPEDGQTIMLVTPTHLYTMAQGRSPLGIDDITGIARASDDPLLIVAKKGSAIDSSDALLQAKTPVKWGVTHVGSIDHASAEMFAKKAGIKLSVVPFEGGGELVTNLMGGNIDIASLNLTEAMDSIERGDLDAIAIMSDQRVDTLPDTPTAKELGVDAEFSTVRGFVAMKGVPEEHLKTLETALLKAMQGDRYQTLLKNTGMPMSSPAPADVWDPQMHKINTNAAEVLQQLGMTN